MADDRRCVLCTFMVEGIALPVVVSKEDFDDASKFSWHPSGGKQRDDRGKLVGRYAARRVTVDGYPLTIYLHRWVAQRMGLLPVLAVKAGLQGRWKSSVDHINGDKLDNRRANLRLRTRTQQNLNANDKPHSNNVSGVNGVSWVEGRQKWLATGQINGESIYLGIYTNRDDAIVARRKWDRDHSWRPDRQPNPRQKLTDAQVDEIRAKLAAGVVQRVLAEEYGVSHGLIGQIACGVARQ